MSSKGIEKTCQCCNCTYIGRRSSKFCSYECSGKSKKTIVEKVCEICNKPYEISKQRSEKSKCCSKKCLGMYSRRKPEPCPVCGEKWIKEHTNHLTCSRKCGAQIRNGPSKTTKEVEVKCGTCDKVFLVKPKNALSAKGKKYIFCSSTCLKKWRSKIMNGKNNPRFGQKAAHRKTNKRSDLENKFFRSTWEANYARILNHLEIKWEYEPKTFVFNNITRGALSYMPDFRLTELDKWVEVKGFLTSKDRTKTKRFRDQYPDEFAKLQFVGNKSLDWYKAIFPNAIVINYDELIKQYAHLIPNWEYPGKRKLNGVNQ